MNPLFFALPVILTCGFWWACLSAPLGYEDERGFHYGEPAALRPDELEDDREAA
jgi:hypothetical protein